MDFLFILFLIVILVIAFPYAIGFLVHAAVWFFMMCAIASAVIIGGAIALIYAITHPKQTYKRYRY